MLTLIVHIKINFLEIIKFHIIIATTDYENIFIEHDTRICTRRIFKLSFFFALKLQCRYVFCYLCILGYLRDNRKCPVTCIPSTEQQLVKLFTQQTV